MSVVTPREKAKAELKSALNHLYVEVATYMFWFWFNIYWVVVDGLDPEVLWVFPTILALFAALAAYLAVDVAQLADQTRKLLKQL